MTSSDYDAISDSATCRTCGTRSDWHNATTGACPDDSDFPHPDSIAADDGPTETMRFDPPLHCAQIGAYGADIDSALAEHASREIDSFTFDEDSEDAESCAQRAADIMRDATVNDAARLGLLIFGNGEDVARLEREFMYHVRTADRRDAFGTHAAAIKAARGIPSVAYELVRNYSDVIAPIIFAGHSGKGWESTNLSAWREAHAAIAYVLGLHSHTYGGMALDGFDIAPLLKMATDAAIDAARWACVNRLNDAECETGMPRAE